MNQNYTRVKFLDALKKQIDFCFSRRKFSCVIFVGSREAQRLCREAMIELGKETNKVKWIKRNAWDSIIRFENYSNIRTFTMGLDLRGQKFESIIIDDTVPEYMHTYLLSSLAPLMDEEGNIRNDDHIQRVFLTSIVGSKTPVL